MTDWKAELLKLTRAKYIDQAKWYMNGFWKKGAEAEAENIWKVAHKFIEIDGRKGEGCELDEFQSHKALEAFGETLTVIQLRERLRKIDADANGKMALLEYLCFKYSKGIQEVVESPQGDNTAELNEAQSKLQAVQKALEDVLHQLEQQKQALANQQSAEQSAKAALEAQKKAEDEVRKAEAEQKAALDDLNSQEAAYQGQIKALEDKINNSTTSVVQRNKAAAELAQLKQQDPLPLRKAKATQEAAVRRVEKERKAAEGATAKAQDAAAEAEAKTKDLEEQTKRVEASVKEAESKVGEAQKFLEQVKKKGGAALGAIWWMERELKEAQKYLPKKKQTLV